MSTRDIPLRLLDCCACLSSKLRPSAVLNAVSTFGYRREILWRMVAKRLDSRGIQKWRQIRSVPEGSEDGSNGPCLLLLFNA